jgi:GNAT superfamily N-acetyltransferase
MSDVRETQSRRQQTEVARRRLGPDIVVRVQPFAEWRRDIAPLWRMEGSYRWIPRIVNGYGQLQYAGHELFTRLRLVPLTAELDGERVAWTSVYNISDEALRVRGIYVLPHARARGIGRALVDAALALWPAPWSRCFIYARLHNVEIYRRWGFEIAPAHLPRTHRVGRRAATDEIVLMTRRFRTATETASIGSEPRPLASQGLSSIGG